MTESWGRGRFVASSALRKSTMNSDLARYIIDAVDRYWAEDVQILFAWQAGPAAAVCRQGP